MQNNKWKEYILKSGLPLEFEVKKSLDKLGFNTKYELSYIRENENNILTEFSYDLESEIVIEDHCFELLIECKYRDESTNWFFLPDDYNYSDRGIGTTGFRNTNDFFYPKDYPDFFKILNFIEISPLCSKGIEICTTGQNPKTLDQAISQLSYAMVDRVIRAMEEQLSGGEDFEPLIYHHVPIIITTANLFRFKHDITIDSVKESTSLSDFAVSHDILLIEPKSSIELKKHAHKKLLEFESKYSKEFLKSKLKYSTKYHYRDFEDYKEEIANFPNGIIVMKHSKAGLQLKKLLTVLKEIVHPSKNTIKKVEKAMGGAIPAFDAFRS